MNAPIVFTNRAPAAPEPAEPILSLALRAEQACGELVEHAQAGDQDRIVELAGAAVVLLAQIVDQLGGDLLLELVTRTTTEEPEPLPAGGSTDVILLAVCRHFELTLQELLGRDKHRRLAFARQVAMWLCRQRLGLSYPELGRLFGRDHSTILSAVNKIDRLVRRGYRTAALVEDIARGLP
jgi:chromosomal replication initiator protein